MFTVNQQDEVIYGLGAIKGLGEGPIENILAARKDSPFSDLFDFLRPHRPAQGQSASYRGPDPLRCVRCPG